MLTSVLIQQLAFGEEDFKPKFSPAEFVYRVSCTIVEWWKIHYSPSAAIEEDEEYSCDFYQCLLERFPDCNDARERLMETMREIITETHGELEMCPECFEFECECGVEKVSEYDLKDLEELSMYFDCYRMKAELYRRFILPKALNLLWGKYDTDTTCDVTNWIDRFQTRVFEGCDNFEIVEMIHQALSLMHHNGDLVKDHLDDYESAISRTDVDFVRAHGIEALVGRKQLREFLTDPAQRISFGDIEIADREEIELIDTLLYNYDYTRR